MAVSLPHFMAFGTTIACKLRQDRILQKCLKVKMIFKKSLIIHKQSIKHELQLFRTDNIHSKRGDRESFQDESDCALNSDSIYYLTNEARGFIKKCRFRYFKTGRLTWLRNDRSI